MKRASQAILIGVASLYPLVCLAQIDGCDAKRHSIEQEIAYAKAHGNAKRVDGLEAALANLNANCSDAALHAAAQEKVAKAQKKLAEREHDLQKARAEGKSAKKIADRQRKVDDAHAELERAQIDAAQ
ncbi:DUF1090 domain-containing protein [Paraburkholderia sp. J67]|uniref:DUF1090 domain-containing protein n=1 Tax=Paraburkholderia sp. J67 TaxID=2805435 RepID=UPI002ABD44D9|nr:DUF1090 domain-containing protein [Paraburkholderia sp. J67]